MFNLSFKKLLKKLQNLKVVDLKINYKNDLPTLYTSAAPAPPTAVVVSYKRSTQFQVKWDHSTDDEVHATTKYRVKCQPTDGGATVEKVTTNMDKFITIDNLVSNTEYAVTVIAITDDADIFSDASEEVLHTTGAYMFCSNLSSLNSLFTGFIIQ